jgi:hypothetical protein
MVPTPIRYTTKAHESWNKEADKAYFGANASLAVPKALHGGAAWYPNGQAAEAGWIRGTRALPAGHRALRIHGADRAVLIGGPPGPAGAADDLAAGGFRSARIRQ